MIIFLSAMAVGFAAFCVWLTVRIINRREGWIKRTVLGVVAGLPVWYALGFGPMCWVNYRTGVAGPQIVFVYQPILSRLWNHHRLSPVSRFFHRQFGTIFQAYADWGTDGNSLIAYDPQYGLFWSGAPSELAEEG